MTGFSHMCSNGWTISERVRFRARARERAMGAPVYRYTEAANGTGIVFDDGSRHTFCSRQRPQLLFSHLAGTRSASTG